MNYKYIKFFFLLIGIFFYSSGCMIFFGSPESIILIEENKSKLFLIILAHIPTLFFDSLAWRIFIKEATFPLCGLL